MDPQGSCAQVRNCAHELVVQVCVACLGSDVSVIPIGILVYCYYNATMRNHLFFIIGLRGSLVRGVHGSWEDCQDYASERGREPPVAQIPI